MNEWQRWQAHTTGQGKSFTETPARPIGERKTAFVSSKAPSLPVSRCPSWFLVTELLSLRLIQTFLDLALVLRTLSVPSIGLRAVASLLEVLAISEISASSSKLSFPLGNLTIVRRWTWMFVKSMLLTFLNINSVLALILLRSMGRSQFILDVIDYRYRIPFHCIPPVSFSINTICPHWRIPVL